MAAIRQEELRRHPEDAQVYEFPTGPVRRAAARERHLVYLRRRVAAACLVALLGVGGVLAVSGARGTEATSRPGAPRQIRVQEGMTLWEVAERYSPSGADPRAYIRATLDLNGLSAPPPPGTRIKLPGSS